jgi:hypothetical protein
MPRIVLELQFQHYQYPMDQLLDLHLIGMMLQLEVL